MLAIWIFKGFKVEDSPELKPNSKRYQNPDEYLDEGPVFFHSINHGGLNLVESGIEVCYVVVQNLFE